MIRLNAGESVLERASPGGRYCRGLYRTDSSWNLIGLLSALVGMGDSLTRLN